MSCSVIVCDDGFITDWVSQGIFGKAGCFEKSTSMGVVRDGKLICGVVYSNYQETYTGEPLSIEMSVYSIDKKWSNRYTLYRFFAYPFIQLRLERVQTTCSAQDEGVIMFNRRLGFINEGMHRMAWPMGGDALSWSMLKSECRWI